MPDRRAAAAALVLALCLLAGCGAPAAVHDPLPALDTPGVLTPLPTPAATPAGYTPLPLYLDGLLCAKAYERDGCAFLPVRAFCNAFDLDMAQSGETDGFQLRIGTLAVHGTGELPYYTAGGRYIWAPEGWLWYGGELYLPMDACAKLFTIGIAREEDRVSAAAAGMRVLSGGGDYYELNFPSDDVYWLSHIISAEARFEPLEGQIGVGNVVLNRMNSPLFPNSVYEVIYDTQHTIQFEPIALGGIKETPSEQSVIAAYLCLEGANTVGDSLYFANPEYGSWWFDTYLQPVVSIGRHNFYKDKDQDA